MAILIETLECYPKEVNLGGLVLPAPEPAHLLCPGGQTQKGIMGGWMCPCVCHYLNKETSDANRPLD